MQKYDVIVIGAGPAGYVAAIRCAQLGMKTACIDNWINQNGEPSPGGTCLNVGCIPSKALLESSFLYEKANHEFENHGIQLKGITLDLNKMIQRKAQVVTDLTSGIEALFKVNKITFISGSGKLLKDKQVQVLTNSTSIEKNTKAKTANTPPEIISAEHIILAPGSIPRAHPNLPFTENLIVDSSDALEFDEVPQSIAILGAGVIGLELGSVWRRLGSKVSLFKSSENLLAAADEQIGELASKILQKQGLKFKFGTSVTGYEIKGKQVSLSYEDKNGKQTEKFDKVIVAIGRIPNVSEVYAKESELKLDDKGFIAVDDNCKTNLSNVYAIGDAVRGPMLAHKGSDEGMMVAELIHGKFAKVNYVTIPFVVYTEPEIAWCGKNEQTLKENKIAYSVGLFRFSSNGRARASGQTEGLLKILADKKTDRILGVHILGAHASELIAQAVIAMEFGSSSEDLALTMFAHPSLSEALHEAALDVDKRAIHK